ncbi:MAG: hybrid sensor histidine kinase/response regulator [Methylococcaceae bacterium]
MPQKKPLILIVDDNPENIRVLGAALKSTEYNLTVAMNGQSAINTIDKDVPSLILLDVMMPDMTGFQVCEKLKNNPKTKDIEIIFVTAAVNVDDELKGLALGAVDYIHKPISIPIVQAKVLLHLERIKNKHELKLKNEALAEVNRLRDDIERITQHDLKTPIHVIMGYSEMMAEYDISEDEKQLFAKAISEAANKILYMVNNSLDLYKMEIGTYEYIPESIAINDLIRGIVKDLKTLAEPKEIKIDIETNDFQAAAEKYLSYSLFANLLRNAIEASPTNSVIEIKMHHENDQSVIAITNSGSVPEAIRATFFEKYATSGKKNGNGLGTYSAKLMAETQRGTIEMETNDHQTCITVRLPRYVTSTDAITKSIETL